MNIRLGELADILGGGTPKRADLSNFGDYIDWVTPTDLPPIGNVGILSTVKEGLTEKGLKGSSAKRIPAGSVLFSSRASIGKIAITDRDCATNQGFANFVPKNDLIEPWFLAYLLKHYTSDILKLAGETTYKEVSRKKLNDFTVRIPQLKEQRRILGRIKEMLERVDEIRTLREESLEEIEFLLSNRCEEVLGNGWQEHRLEDLLCCGPSNGIFKKRKDFGDGVLLANVKDLYNDYTISPETLERVNATNSEIDKYILKEGDVLVNRSSLKKEGLGRSCMFASAEEPVVFECHIMRIRFKPDTLHPFLFTCFMNSRMGLKRILAKAKTATMTTWNQGDLGSIMIPVPPLEEQENMVEELRAFKTITDNICEKLLQSKEQSNFIINSLLNKAFSGEL